MVNYISKYHLFYLLLLIGCTNSNNEKLSKIQSLPDNSITKLLNSTTQLSFERGEISNLDKINGFRNLKFKTIIENLYFEDWADGNSSHVFNKDMVLEFNNNNKNCKVSVFFFEEKVAKISISWTDESSTLDVEGLLVKAFGKPKSRKHYDNIDSLIKRTNSFYQITTLKNKKINRNNIFEDEFLSREIEYNLECSWESNFVHLLYFEEHYKAIRRDSITNLLELKSMYQQNLNFICREYEHNLIQDAMKVKEENELRNSIQKKNESIEAAKNF